MTAKTKSKAAEPLPKNRMIVLDDDPTGSQTVHDLPVITEWTENALRSALAEDTDCFFILTNTRAMLPEKAAAVTREIAVNLRAVVGPKGRLPLIVSRSDSTLRGHYPVETDVLSEELGPFAATFIIPYFEAGGRQTKDDVHYIVEGRKSTPVAQTPYAKDGAFAYKKSNLREWVQEKTGGRIKAAKVASISLAVLRKNNPEALAAKILALPKDSVCIVNSCKPSDLQAFIDGLLIAEGEGRRYLFRTAAQFVLARLQQKPKPMLEAKDLGLKGFTGGLTVVGSHVPATSLQLGTLLEADDLCRIELPVETLLMPSQAEPVITATVARANEQLFRGYDVVIYTSRKVVAGADAAANLTIGQRISTALVEIVRQLAVQPRYLIVKGGITSSDIATGSLAVKRATVSGQIQPGVSVWTLGPESLFPGLSYIVFPGNVGDADALAALRDQLRKGRS